MSSVLSEALKAYFSAGELERLGSARVGIAGAGGIGSNVALMLVRSGVRHLTVYDHDVVEPRNLNRQQYFPEDVGCPKVEALERRLRSLEPELDCRALKVRGDEKTLPDLLPLAELWIEAMDAPESKRLFTERALMAGHPVIACSGMAGVGGPVMKVRRLGLLTLVGDGVSDIRDLPPLAPRVTECAALMADAALEYLLKSEKIFRLKKEKKTKQLFHGTKKFYFFSGN